MRHNFHVFPDLVFLFSCFAAQFFLTLWARQFFRQKWLRAAAYLLSGLCLAGYSAAYLFLFWRVNRHFPVDVVTWTQGVALIAGLLALGTAVLGALVRRVPYREDRRALFRSAGAVVMASPAAVTAFGILHRNDFRITETDIPIPGLPRDLHGLRLVQVTDIHLSAFLSEQEFARAIDMANETRAHVALATGDFITRRGDPLDAAVRQIGRLRAEAGVFGCMGNHEAYAQVQDYTMAAAALRGIRFLRSEAADLRFGNSTLHLAGVDYQPFNTPYLVGAESLLSPGNVNILLSHNPDVLPAAAAQGWDLMIAGHTHGGQIGVEILHHNLSAARYYTPYVRGLYRIGKSAGYVSTGLGTVGLPVRLGAPPEVSLIRLCAT